MSPSADVGTTSSGSEHLRPMPPERYVDFEIVGEGGMGIVYLALDTDLNRQVALKIVRPQGDEAEATPATPVTPQGVHSPRPGTPGSEEFHELQARFLQEAWITSGLEHPGIVPVYEVGRTVGGVPYYTMRFVRGRRTLANALEEVRGRPIEDRLALLEPFLKLCDAVAYAHANGVVHRDLKPQNVALGQFGEVVLLDWGLAKVEGREDPAQARWRRRIEDLRGAQGLHTVAAALGTPGYMAPEAALGHLDEVDARSDVYSLGAILFELLTGHVPVRFSSPGEFFAAMQERQAEEASHADPAVPAPLSEVCRRALSRDRSERPEGARALADSIRAWQRESAVEREVEGLLREARAGLRAAADAHGEDRLREVERVAGVLAGIEARRPGDAAARALHGEAETLRASALRERDRARARRLLVRGAVAVLLVTTLAGFGVARVIEGRRRAEEAQRQRAERAEAATTDRLWDAYLGQARAARRSGGPGRRFDALDAIRAAAAIRPSADLRDEAVAALALPDLKERRLLDLPRGETFLGADPEFRTYVRADPAGDLTVASAATGEVLYTLPSPGGRCLEAGLSRDGRWLWSKHDSGRTGVTMVVWNVAQRRACLTDASSVSASFAPDGASVALSGSDHTIRIHDLATGGRTATLKAMAAPGRVVWSPDGASLATSSIYVSGVEILRREGGSRILPLPGIVRGIAWSPAGDRLAACCHDDFTYVWDVRGTPRIRYRVAHEHTATVADFAHEQPLLLCAGWDGKQRVVDSWTGDPLAVGDGAAYAGFRADDRAIGFSIRKGTEVGIWDLALSASSFRVPGEAPLPSKRTVSFSVASPDGRFVAVCEWGGLRVWSLADRSVVAWVPSPDALPPTAAFAQDGRVLLTSWRGGVYRFDVPAAGSPWGPLRELALPRELEGARVQCSLPRTSHVVLSRETTAWVVDLEGEARVLSTLGPTPGSSPGACASPDARWVATSGWQGVDVRIWDAAAGTLVRRLETGGSATCAFSPDSRFLVTGSFAEYARFEVGTWKKVASAPRQEIGAWSPITFSPDGRIFLGRLDPRTSHLLDASTLETLVSLGTPPGETGADAVLSGDGLWAVSGAAGDARFWHLPTLRRELRALGLDWSDAPIPDAPPPSAARPPPPPVPDFAGPVLTAKVRPVLGTRKVVAILFDPHRAEHPAPPRATIEALLAGPRPSVVDWFREVSGGRLSLDVVKVLGWYDAAKPAEHYWGTNETSDPDDRDHDGWIHGHAEKWAEAVRRADAEFDFAAHDANHDGVLTPEELCVLVVIPQAGPFGTVREAAGRESPAVEPLVVDGVRIPVVAEWYTGIPANLGAPAHELCHLLLGAPDLYPTVATPFAPGAYCLMDRSYSSAHLDPFLKLKAGWIGAEVAVPGFEYVVPAVESGGRVLVLYDPEHGPGEYFLVENRWRPGSYDAGVGEAGAGLPSDGIAVWHVLEDPALLPLAKPENGGPTEWGRRGIRLLRANGGTPADDAAALFSRPSTILAPDSNPASLRWLDGSAPPFALEILTPAGPDVRVAVRRR